MMKILVVGGGGREHALAWKLAQSRKVKNVYVAPGNAGCHFEANVHNIDIPADDLDNLLYFALKHEVDLTVIGPEVPLVMGIVDLFEENGLRCFGPSKGAAQLEGSKKFTKDFLARHNIPTAAYASFTNTSQAIEYLNQQDMPIVIKADGLAAGKGVVIAETVEHAIETVTDMLSGNAFGEAGHQVVIEEFMRGEEASFIAIVDGKNALPMATSQDHKARDNGDTGPNTGGMGAYSPAPVVTPDVHARIMEEVILPTIKGMADEGNAFRGFLYAGLMIDETGAPRVVEYNVRFGDPETQPIMMRLQSDLLELIESTFDGTLTEQNVEWDPRVALGVVIAAGGYPESYKKDDEISGSLFHSSHRTKVFHAGTRVHGEDVFTNGGRVLCVVSMAEETKKAQSLAYDLVKRIEWNNMYYRTDIGHRAISREE